MVVSAEDATPAVDTTFNGTVTASLATGAGTLANATVTAVNGVATFSALTITGTAGSFSLTFTSGALPTVTSNTFNLATGAATKLAIRTPPGGAASGLALTTQPVVAVEDSGGNVVLGASGTVNAAMATGTGYLTNASASIVSGEAQFSNLTITGSTSGTISLTFYATGITGLATATSTALTLKAGHPSQLVITRASSTNATSGVVLATVPLVSLEDSYGNVVTTAATAVTLSIASGNGTATTTTSPVNTTSGVATFTGLTITATTPGSFTLLFQAVGVTSVTSPAILVAGAASQLVLTTQPAGATTGVSLATQPVVAVEDANGNVVTNYTGTVTATLASGSATLTNYTASITNGVATFTSLTLTGTPSQYTLSFVLTPLTAALSGVQNLTGAASGLAIVTQPAGAANGSAFTTQPVVEVVDANGKLVASASGTMTATLQSSTSGESLSNYTATITRGVATFASLAVTGATTSVVLVFLVTGLTPVTSSSMTLPGTATKLVLTTAPSGAANGTAVTTQPVVTVEDANGTVVTNYSGTVTASFATGAGTLTNATANVVNGVATFSGLAFTGSGSFSLTFATSGLASAQSGVLALSGTATKLVLTTAPSGAANGTAVTTQPVVTVEDANGTVVTNYSGTVTASFATGAGTLTNATANVVNGVATFSGLAFTGSGSFSLTFATSGLASAQSGVLALSSTGYKLVVLTQPYGAVNGSALSTQPVVAVEDANGNVVTGFSNTMTASINVGSGTLSNATAVVTNGVATFASLSITGTAGNVALFFRVTSVTGVASSLFSLGVGPAAQLVATAPSVLSSQSGVSLKNPPVVKIEDVGGNPVANYSGNVTANLVSGAATLSSATAVLVNGVATFSGLALTGSVGTYQLQFSVGGFTTSTALTTELTGAPAKLVVGVAPSSSAPSSAALEVQPVIDVVDASGNVVATANGTVTVTMTPSTGRITNATANFVNGVASFSGLALDAKVGAYTLVFKSPLAATSVSAAVRVLVGAATRLVLVTPVSQNTVSGRALLTQPVLQLEDAFGNVVPTSASAVAVITHASPASASGGVPTTLVHNQVTASGGVVRFSGLSVSGATGPVKVTFSVGGLSTTSTLDIRLSSFFAPLQLSFPSAGGNLTLSEQNQIRAFASRMASVQRFVVVGYAPYQRSLALLRAREVAAVLAQRLKTTIVIRVVTATSLNQAVLGLQ